jgi:AcrR family transcriptional regulator
MTPRANGAKSPTSRNRDASVIAAAIEVMSEKGYAATSIQEVADRVGVLKGSLYHYFDSKEELLSRILAESHATMDELQAEIRSQGLRPYEELMEYIRRQTIWYLENRDRANIYFTERRHLTGERRQRALEAGRAFEKYVQDLVVAAQEDGDIRQDQDYRLITRFLTGALNGVRFWPSRSGKQFSIEEISEASVALVRSAIAA